MKKKKMSTKMKEEHEKVMAKHPAGSGERFMHMTKVLKKKGAKTQEHLLPGQDERNMEQRKWLK